MMVEMKTVFFFIGWSIMASPEAEERNVYSQEGKKIKECRTFLDNDLKSA